MAAFNPETHQYKTPDNSRVVQLESMSEAQQKHYLELMEPLLAKSYPTYVDQEDIQKRWLDAMQHKEKSAPGYEMGITAVIKTDPVTNKEEVTGFTTTEFIGKAAYHGYSVGQYNNDADKDGATLKHPLNPDEYADVMYASKLAASADVKARQSAGQIINLEIQEGAHYKSAHLDKMIPGLAAGQVSLGSATAINPLTDSVIPVYSGDIAKNAKPEDIQKIVNDPYKVDLLITNLVPSENKPLKEIMAEFKTDYLRLHGSPVVDPSNPNTQFKDPYGKIMDNYIEKIPADLTLQQAYAAAAPGAAQRLNLQPTADLSAEGLEKFAQKYNNLTPAQQANVVKEASAEHVLSQAYIDAGADPEKRIAAQKLHPELATAYEGEEAYKATIEKTGAHMTPQLLDQYRNYAAATLSAEGGIERMQAALAERKIAAPVQQEQPQKQLEQTY